MRTLFLVLTLIIMASCSNDDNSQNAYYLDNQIYIKYENSSGQNLLDISTTGAYSIDDIKLFYLIDNEPVEATIENGFNMGDIELTPNNLLKIFTNVSVSDVIEEIEDYKIVENIAYLELSEADTDTIKTYSQVGYNYFKVYKVWYNDELVWERETGEVIEIMKE